MQSPTEGHPAQQSQQQSQQAQPPTPSTPQQTQQTPQQPPQLQPPQSTQPPAQSSQTPQPSQPPQPQPAQPSQKAAPQPAAKQTTETPSNQKPNDARTIEAILHTMGVDQYDPRVTHQLLELLYRYVSTVLSEARSFSEHADKPKIDAEDIKLAIRSRSSLNFTQPPPRDVTSRLATERNAIPLPPIDDHASLAFPPAAYQLTRQNYKVVQANHAQIQKAKRVRENTLGTIRPQKRPAFSSDNDVIVIDDAPPVTQPVASVSAKPNASPAQPMEIVDVDAAPIASTNLSSSPTELPNISPTNQRPLVGLESIPPPHPPGARPMRD